ncbi:MAG: polysaccharide biosynthesis/export family protein [Pirellulaceae bacterium]|nr:polysaccharide biosynthesis/export family protein [Pirellulaceae bacterium]
MIDSQSNTLGYSIHPRQILWICLAIQAATLAQRCSAQDVSGASVLDRQSALSVEIVGPHQPLHTGLTAGPKLDNAGHCHYSACNPPMQPQVALGRCQPCIQAVDCADNCGSHQTWRDLHPYNFQPLGHGEYQGPVRLQATIDYRVRVGDRLQFIFAKSREMPIESYVLLIGDELQITSITDSAIQTGDVIQGRGIAIQPDGYLHLKQIGRIRAAGLTISQLRRNLELAYQEFVKEPGIDVLPIKTNSQLDDILEAIDARQGISGGRTITETIHPDGTVRLIKIGAVCVHGLTLDEVKREINLRYRQLQPGLYVEPILETEAPHFVFVYGAVAQPNRYQINGPTSVTAALAQAGGINVRGNAREIVIFRRAEDWRLLSTRVDLKGMHLGKVPTPADEIWLRDNDLILVPLTPIARFDDFVDQVFRQGIYGIFPLAQVGSGFNAAVFQFNN